MSVHPAINVEAEGTNPLTRGFLIEYDGARGILLIDGVEVSTTILLMILVEPRNDMWFRFRREGNVVLVDTQPVK